MGTTNLEPTGSVPRRVRFRWLFAIMASFGLIVAMTTSGSTASAEQIFQTGSFVGDPVLQDGSCVQKYTVKVEPRFAQQHDVVLDGERQGVVEVGGSETYSGSVTIPQDGESHSLRLIGVSPVTDTENEVLDTKTVTCPAPPTDPEPAQPTVSATSEDADRGQSNGTATVTVTNTTDDTGSSVVYSVTLNGVTKQTTSVADGATGTVSFTALAADTYAVSVAGDDGTSAVTSVTVKEKSSEPTPEPAEPTGSIGEVVCDEGKGSVVLVFGNEGGTATSLTWSVDGVMSNVEVPVNAGQTVSRTIALTEGRHTVAIWVYATEATNPVASGTVEVKCAVTPPVVEPSVTVELDECKPGDTQRTGRLTVDNSASNYDAQLMLRVDGKDAAEGALTVEAGQKLSQSIAIDFGQAEIVNVDTGKVLWSMTVKGCSSNPSPTDTPTSTPTNEPTPTGTHSPTATPTDPPTSTGTHTPTPTHTGGPTGTNTNSPSPTSTPTVTNEPTSPSGTSSTSSSTDGSSSSNNPSTTGSTSTDSSSGGDGDSDGAGSSASDSSNESANGQGASGGTPKGDASGPSVQTGYVGDEGSNARAVVGLGAVLFAAIVAAGYLTTRLREE